MSGHLLTLPVDRARAEALLDDDEALAALPGTPTLVAREVEEDSDDWVIDAYYADAPDAAARRALTALVGAATAPRAQALPDEDWVTLSQAGLEPVRAGRFFVHTHADPPSDDPGVTSFRIEASRAFGTGHHDTTAGCLAALDALARRGRRYRHIADIGTGTGLLAFAALHLWPRAHALASDIDPVSVAVSAENALVNGVTLGPGAGELALTVADGTDAPLIRAAAPFDLIVANILARPLIALAPAIAQIAAPGGTLLLAGLTSDQRAAVLAAYRRAGFRLDDAGELGAHWPVLRLTRRRRYGWQRPARRSRAAAHAGDTGEW